MAAAQLSSVRCNGGAQAFAPAQRTQKVARSQLQVMAASIKEVRDRIGSVSNTKKITEAMKLVAAAKVRRAQEAVVNGRPFAENLVKVLYGVNQRLRVEDVDSPLVAQRAVKSVALVAVTGDRGLCGGYNNFVIKKVEARYKELAAMGIAVRIICVGRKGSAYFKRRPQFTVEAVFEVGQSPTIKEAQAIADDIFADFVSQEVDKVELIYTKFVSLIASSPVVQTLLPLTPSGEVCDVNGVCVDAAEDEIFKLTTLDGQLAVKTETVRTETADLDAGLIFEQDPVQIVDALLPLYMNASLLRSLQEALASELAARMNAMSNASDNAGELKKKFTLIMNRKRQAKITTELTEIVAESAATPPLLHPCEAAASAAALARGPAPPRVVASLPEGLGSGRFPPPLFPHGSLSPPAGRDGIMRSATAPHAGAGEASEAATPGASVTAQHGDRHTAALDTPGQGSPMRHCSLEGRSNSKQHGSAGPGLEDAAAALAGVADSPAMAAAAEPLSKPRLRVQGADIILEDAPSPKAPTPVEPSASSRQLAAAAALGNGGGVASSPAAAAAPAGAQQHAQAAALQQHHVVAAARASQSHEHELQLRLASRTVTGLSNLAVVSSRPTMQINSGGHGIADERLRGVVDSNGLPPGELGPSSSDAAVVEGPVRIKYRSTLTEENVANHNKLEQYASRPDATGRSSSERIWRWLEGSGPPFDNPPPSLGVPTVSKASMAAANRKQTEKRPGGFFSCFNCFGGGGGSTR
ncbi:ATP synthase gamma-subunit [Micractinium conductrix]|uniref:F-ATPase gamma subunit n=1 Tax=Micractinium conductrix TaxID=554055 RepID=A0A2P6V661_9CHLO|nr:ATP synthase gamma-subunit [Micractinium conductrix]|eukprot:PSC69571.1 ATP synthase gamma-subunit [Micractinium conductrix]